jgi:hypothetical protein
VLSNGKSESAGQSTMKTLSDLIVSLLLAVVLLAAFFAFAMGFRQPEKNGTLSIAGAILAGSVILSMAILSRPGNGRE